MSSRSKKIGFQRSFSAISSSPARLGWFREPRNNWSPNSDDSDHSLNSDEENHVAMETDCNLDNAASTVANKTFTLDAPMFPNNMVPEISRTNEVTCSNKSLLIGRPVRSVGLKHVDLTRNTRAEEIRRAKEASKCTDKRHIFSPIRQNSSPAIMSDGFQDNRQQGLLQSLHKSPENRYFPRLGQSNKNITNFNTKIKPDLSIVLYDSNTAFNPSKQRSKTSYKLPKLYSTEAEEEKEDCGMSWIGEASHMDDTEVIEIDDENPLPRALVNHDNVTQRKPRKQSKSPKFISFSDDEDNDDKINSSVRNSTSEKSNKNPDTSHDKRPEKPINLSSVFTIFVFIVSVAVAAIYLHVNPHGLCLDSEFRHNLTGLESDLNQEFYGQHLAMRVLLSSLKSHSQFTNKNKPLVLSLHGWTGTGKNFVTGLIAKHIFKQGLDSKFVYKFIIPLHFPHVSEVGLYRQQLHDWILGNITKCNKGGLFIFDEMDKIPPGVVTVLKPFLDPKGAKNNLDFQNVIFLFLSNTGGKSINNYVLQYYKKGLAREDIELVQLEHLLHSYADANPTAWYQELIASEVIDHFVPFLPLERSHVKQCVKKDLKSKGFIELETMVTEIANEMTYIPEDLELFSVSGCKKVSSKVDVAMG